MGMTALELARLADLETQPASGDYLSFCLGAAEYGINLLQVLEIRGYENPARIAGAPACLKGVLNLRGVIVPIVDLRLLLGCASAEVQRYTVVIMVGVQGRVVGAVVDAVNDVLALAGDALQPGPAAPTRLQRQYITGVANTAGRRLVLMDIDALLASVDIGMIEQPLA